MSTGQHFPLAYHITFGTYGARLHGSEKPQVDRDHNEYGKPLAPVDPDREEAARRRMKHDPVHLTREQREVVEAAIREVAGRYGWTIYAIAPQSDHTHVVLSAPREGQALRDALKAVASRALNKRFGTRPWWAEKGSAKYLWDEEYLRSATKYVNDQRDF